MRLLNLVLLSSLMFTSVSFAQETSEDRLSLPRRGIDKARVESTFGRPLQKESPVGDPPISRWIYDQFTVVFEYNHVIHAFKRSAVVESIASGDLPARPDLTLPPRARETVPAPTYKPQNDESSGQNTGETSGEAKNAPNEAEAQTSPQRY